MVRPNRVTERPVRISCAIFGIVGVFIVSAVRAEDPPRPDAVITARSVEALERLKSRSPHERWKARKEAWRRSMRKRAERRADQPAEATGVPALGPDSKESERRRPDVRPIPDEVEPRAESKNPAAGVPTLVAVQDPPPPNGSSSGQAYEPRRGISVDRPEELPKVTTILPYPDYSPEDEPTVQEGRRPEETEDYVAELSETPYEGREIPESLFMWEASNLYHNPLYFQDVQLERYGHTHHDLLQPFASAGLFSAQLIGLPYQMAIDPIHECKYPLGWYRPGEYAPKLYYQVPWNLDAALTEAGVVTGAFFLFP